MQHSTVLKFSLVAGFLVLSAGLHRSVLLLVIGITWMLIVSAVACVCSRSRINCFDAGEADGLPPSAADARSGRLSLG